MLEPDAWEYGRTCGFLGVRNLWRREGGKLLILRAEQGIEGREVLSRKVVMERGADIVLRMCWM